MTALVAVRWTRSEEADGCCWYDMVYNPQAVGMFRYLHSNPVANSQRILREVLDTLEEKLYKPTACPADAEKIERYIETKVDGNLKKLHDDRPAGIDGLWHAAHQRHGEDHRR